MRATITVSLADNTLNSSMSVSLSSNSRGVNSAGLVRSTNRPGQFRIGWSSQVVANSSKVFTPEPVAQHARSLYAFLLDQVFPAFWLERITFRSADAPGAEIVDVHQPLQTELEGALFLGESPD